MNTFRLAPLMMTLLLTLATSVSAARGADQTATLSPVHLDSTLPYDVSIQPYDFGAAALPTLHSFAAGRYDGKWVLIAGRTNGLHGLGGGAGESFPPEFQNRDVWAVDPVTRESWHRSLDDPSAGFSIDEINSLTPANNQFYQSGDQLYMAGGYGVKSLSSDGTGINGTFDELTAIDLPGMLDWVVTGAGSASDHVRQLSDPLFSVTGGAMHEINGRTHLVFGQDFEGNYNPIAEGTYTNQVRSFEVIDDGVTLSIADASSTAPDLDFRRRDLNVVPVMRLGPQGSLEEGLVAFSGVFTFSFGAWTVPVEIDDQGQPTMADPADLQAFKQGMNNYHSAKLGFFSEDRGAMHELLFGGISLQYKDHQTGQIETDMGLPFVNDVTSVVIDSSRGYSQHRIGEFPKLFDREGKRLRFGTNAEFFLAEGIETYDNGVIKMDALTEPTLLGYIFGGIVTNGPHTQANPPAASAASNMIFTVMYTPVPEPQCLLLAAMGATAIARLRRRLPA